MIRLSLIHFNPDDPCPRMLGTTLLVLVESEGFLDDTFMDAAGIEQMETILTPYGETEMGNLETVLIGGHCEDVTIMDELAQQAVLTSMCFGNIAVLQSGEGLFLQPYFGHPLRMTCQRDIGIGVLAHVGGAQGLYSNEGRTVTLYLLYIAKTSVIDDPVTEIMQARSVAIKLTIAVAEHTELTQVVLECLLATGNAEAESYAHLNECSAVQFAGIDDQVLVIREELQRVGHIGTAQELTCDIERIVSGRFVQQSNNHQAVLLGVGHLLGT